MKNASVERAIELSRRRYELEITKDWRYVQFFNYLQVSPSYALAEAMAEGSVALRDTQLPADFGRVQRTYEAFGSVHKTYFWDWWVRRAQYQFGVSIAAKPTLLKTFDRRQAIDNADIEKTQIGLVEWLTIDRQAYGLPAVALIATPLHGNREKLLKDLAEMIDRATDSLREDDSITSFRFQRNKIRFLTLRTALKVLRARAALPDKRLFVIGNRSGVSRANVTSEKAARGDKPVSDARRNMEILTSRWLHRAYVLAENAARGRFPSLEALEYDSNRPQFDYHELQKRLKEQMNWMETELGRLRPKQASSSKHRL